MNISSRTLHKWTKQARPCERNHFPHIELIVMKGLHEFNSHLCCETRLLLLQRNGPNRMWWMLLVAHKKGCFAERRVAMFGILINLIERFHCLWKRTYTAQFHKYMLAYENVRAIFISVVICDSRSDSTWNINMHHPPFEHRHTQIHTHTHQACDWEDYVKVVSCVHFSRAIFNITCALATSARDRICTHTHNLHVHYIHTWRHIHWVNVFVSVCVRCGKHVSYIMSHFVEHVLCRAYARDMRAIVTRA